MEFHYPKFLKATPVFMGLTLLDLGFVSFILLISTIAELEAHWVLVLILINLGILKLVRIKLPRLSLELILKKKRKLKWSYALEKLYLRNQWTDSL
ncbi:MAG: hypothetical protein ACOYL6_17460 [Bacteriovoracaceae bacterium]